MKTRDGIMMGLVIIVAFVVGIAGARMLAAPALPVTPAGELIITPAVCDPQATGNLAPELRFEITNPLNTAKENKYDSVRVYEVPTNTDASTATSVASSGYVNSVTTSASGLIADGSGQKCECDNTYLLVTTVDQVAAGEDNTGNSSTALTMVCEKNDNVAIKSGSTQQPDLAHLQAKVYNNDDKAYCYSNYTVGGTSTGTFTPLMLMLPNATCNTGAGNWNTAPTISTDGYLDLTIVISTNSSTATDTQFNDQSFLIGLDLQSEDDWAEPTTLSFEGESILDDEIDCPTKIANLGIDYCYLVPGNPSISTTKREIDMYIQALSGVNPDDDVEIHFFTSGWKASTVDNSVAISYTDDAPAKNLVYLGNNITIPVS